MNQMSRMQLKQIPKNRENLIPSQSRGAFCFRFVYSISTPPYCFLRFGYHLHVAIVGGMGYTTRKVLNIFLYSLNLVTFFQLLTNA